MFEGEPSAADKICNTRRSMALFYSNVAERPTDNYTRILRLVANPCTMDKFAVTSESAPVFIFFQRDPRGNSWPQLVVIPTDPTERKRPRFDSLYA